ncbi:MAG TPA: phospho-N-acetylmuramoyl-pentapeptide-transferase [Methylomirabilota bacterium]|nr:phospho-N-acetylmuramoyl-pentapeptide-transferase [Methylomirabilota bacterium]
MLFYLSQYLQAQAEGTEWESTFGPLRLLTYITFRSAGAAITALLLSWFFGPKVIAWLKRLKFGQDYADKAEEAGGMAARIINKKGTPTMGGLLIVLVVDLSAILWAQWNELIILTLLSLVVLAGLGFYDDYAKITKQTSAGAAENVKLVVQAALALFISIYLLSLPSTRHLISEVMVPFYKYPILTGVGWVGIIISSFAIIGSSNAVNLTDGLDGLAIGCTLIVTSVFVVFTYIAGNKEISGYLQVPHVPGAGELTILCSALVGASLGFLWYNCHPAQVFMGDTGSLAIGGVLGIIAVLIHQPFILPIAGGVFVAEALSVMIQRGWFKYTKRTRGAGERIFLMAPLHHHFEKKGWYESQVVTRFYILCVLCALIALSSLKLR